MKYVYAVIFSVIVLLMQMLLVPVISFVGIEPDFIIIFIALIGCYFGKTTIPLVAVVLGCAFDLTTNGNIFINTVSYIVCAVGLVAFRIFSDEVEFPVYLLATAAFVIIKGFVTMCGLYVLELSEGILLIVLLKSIPSAIYTTLLAIPFYYMFKLLLKFNIKKKNDNFLPI